MTEPVTLRLVGENGQLVGVLRSTKEGLKGLGDETKKTDETVRRVMPAWAKEAKNASGSFDMLNGSARDLAKTMIAGLGFAGVAASVQNAIKEATDFNREIAKISTALSDTSALEGYSKELRRMAREYGLAAKQQAASLYEIISAGQDADTAMRTLDAANRLAVGGLTSVETAADGLTSVMNAYAGKIRDAAEVSDILFVGAAAGKTNIEQLSNSLGLVANTASTVGVSFDELVGSIATITLSGVQTSVAVTQMRAALNAIVKPSSEAAELAKKLGLNFSVSAVQTKGWAGFLEELSEKTGNNISTLATLFGSTEAVSGILSVTGEKADKFAGIMDQMAASTGATDVAFKKMADTADFQFKRAQTAANDLAIEIGNKLLIALAPAAEAFADNIDGIAAAMGSALEVTVAYVAVFRALPALYLATEKAIWAMVAAQNAGNAGFLASIKNIGLMKIAAGGLFAAWAGWEIGTTLNEKFVEVRIFGIALVAGLLKAFNNLKYGVGLVWEGIKLSALLAFEGITEGLAGMLRSVAQVGDVQVGGKRLFGDSVDGILALADGLSNAMDPVENFNKAVKEQSVALIAANAKIDEYAEGEVAFALAADKAAKAEKKQADITKTIVPIQKAMNDALENTKEELERIAEEAKRAEASLAAWLEIYDSTRRLENAQHDLAQGYANEISLLERSNEERQVGAELLNYMKDNYEDLTMATEKAAQAKLNEADATIRSNLATIRAKEHINDLVAEFGNLDNVGLSGLLNDLEKVEKELARISNKDLMGDAFDPKRVEELRGTVTGLNYAIGVETQMALENNVSAMQAGFRSLQSMASEGSKAYQAMEIAIQAANVVAAIGAIVNQGNGDPYTAFARMAAMAAAVSGLVGSIVSFGAGGVSSSGAESRQRTQGTGTVLGDADAKSESMLNALDIIAEATSQLPGLSRGMLSALQSMQRGISGASASVARIEFGEINLDESFFTANAPGSLAGRVLGSIFGGDQDLIDQGIRIAGGNFGSVSQNPNATSYQTIETDGGWFSSDDIDDEFEDLSERAITQIQLILQSLGDAVRAGAEALGMDMDEVNRAIRAFEIEEIRISTMDLTGEEAQRELEAAFSAIFDGLAEAVVPFIGQFQRVGEGLGETLVRVATSVMVAQEGLYQLGIAIGDLDPEQLAQMSVGLIEAAGGIDKFISGMQSFVANFAPEAHRLEIAQSELTRGLAQVGLTLPTTREGFWELMQSLDATTESGQEQIATLLRLSDYADRYYSHLEDAAEDAEDAAREAREAVLEEMQRIADSFAEAAEIMGSARTQYAAPTSQRETAINDINRNFDGYISRLRDLPGALENITELEGLRIEALARANAAIDEQINRTLDDLAFGLNVDGLDDAAYALAEINRQYDQYRAQLIQQGATTEQLTRLEELRTIALEQSAEAVENFTISLGDLFDQLNVYIEDLREQFAHLMNPGFRNWIEDLTGFAPAAETAIVSLNDTMDTIRQSYADGVTSLSMQIAASQAELDALGNQGGPQRSIIQSRINYLRQMLNDVTTSMADALEYATELFQQQIGSLLIGLREEFGADDPIARINDRFDLLIEQATAWGASMLQLAEIESYRQIALAQAQEQSFEDQMEWLRQLKEFRDGLLLDENLSTLTPMERLAEAQRQYESALASGLDTADEQATFQEAARAYLENLRSAYGSSDTYTQGFNRVLQDISELIENSPLGANGALSDILGSAGDEDGQVITVNVDPVVAAVASMHGDINLGFAALISETAENRAEIAQVRASTDAVVAAVDRLTNSGVLRTN